MTKKSLAILILSLLSFGWGPFSLFAQIPGEPLYETYQAAMSEEQRLRIVEDIVKQPNEKGPFLSFALQDLVTRRLDLGNSRDMVGKNKIAVLLMHALALIQYKEAAPLIFQVFEDTQDAVTKGEAALALGQLKQTQFSLALAVSLNKINASLTKTGDEEFLAFSLVKALEKMADPVAFEPLFLASYGWYSGNSKVRDAARLAYPMVTEDLFSSLVNTLKQTTDPKKKQLALETLRDQLLDADQVYIAAAAGLDEGLSWAPTQAEEISALSKLRLTALQMLIRSKDSHPQAIPLLRRVFEKNYNSRETLTTIQALGLNSTDASAEYLISLLSEFNTKQKNGANTNNDQSVIKQIIWALGLTKNPLAKDTLTEVRFSQFSSSIIKEAEKALKEIP